MKYKFYLDPFSIISKTISFLAILVYISFCLFRSASVGRLVVVVLILNLVYFISSCRYIGLTKDSVEIRKIFKHSIKYLDITAVIEEKTPLRRGVNGVMELFLTSGKTFRFYDIASMFKKDTLLKLLNKAIVDKGLKIDPAEVERLKKRYRFEFWVDLLASCVTLMIFCGIYVLFRYVLLKYVSDENLFLFLKTDVGKEAEKTVIRSFQGWVPRGTSLCNSLIPSFRNNERSWTCCYECSHHGPLFCCCCKEPEVLHLDVYAFSRDLMCRRLRRRNSGEESSFPCWPSWSGEGLCSGAGMMNRSCTLRVPCS